MELTLTGFVSGCSGNGRGREQLIHVEFNELLPAPRLLLVRGPEKRVTLSCFLSQAGKPWRARELERGWPQADHTRGGALPLLTAKSTPCPVQRRAGLPDLQPVWPASAKCMRRREGTRWRQVRAWTGPCILSGLPAFRTCTPICNPPCLLLATSAGPGGPPAGLAAQPWCV